MDSAFLEEKQKKNLAKRLKKPNTSIDSSQLKAAEKFETNMNVHRSSIEEKEILSKLKRGRIQGKKRKNKKRKRKKKKKKKKKRALEDPNLNRKVAADLLEEKALETQADLQKDHTATLTVTIEDHLDRAAETEEKDLAVPTHLEEKTEDAHPAADQEETLLLLTSEETTERKSNHLVIQMNDLLEQKSKIEMKNLREMVNQIDVRMTRNQQRIHRKTNQKSKKKNKITQKSPLLPLRNQIKT